MVVESLVELWLLFLLLDIVDVVVFEADRILIDSIANGCIEDDA